MDTNNIVGEIKKQATNFALELNIPKGELDHEFNKYWAEVKDVLSPNLVKAATKGGYRQVTKERAVKAAGGLSEFFKPVLADVVSNYLDKQDKQALTINSVEVVETLTQYAVRALVQLEPEVTWKKVPGVDVPLTVRLPKPPDGIIDRMVNDELEVAREKSAILVPVDDGVAVAEGHVIAMDCESLLDGKVWVPGTFKNNKWLISKALFHIPEMMDALLGSKVGESKKVQVVLNDKFSENVRGKTVDITMRVNQIYNKEMPEIDNDLAITFGFTDLDAYKNALREKCTTSMANDKAKLTMLSITSQLMNPEVVDVEPVPFTWMAHKAKELYGQGRSTVKTEEELISAFNGQTLTSGEPVVDKNSLLNFLAEKAAQQLIHDLVLRSWGKKRGVQGDLTLGAMAEYVAEVQKSLLDCAVIEEYVVEESK